MTAALKRRRPLDLTPSRIKVLERLAETMRPAYELAGLTRYRLVFRVAEGGRVTVVYDTATGAIVTRGRS